MELVEIENPESRFTIVIPENYVKFPRHFSLTQAILYSPKALGSIKQLIDGKQSYIVPGRMGKYDLKLSQKLAIPILSGDPFITGKFSTKFGARAVLEEARIPTPIGVREIIKS